MSYQQAVENLLTIEGIELSTMMKTPCLRFNGDFIAMMFDKADSLIIKVSPQRVDELIAEGSGNEFNFTKKKFKEWVLIPIDLEDKYEVFIREAMAYAQSKKSR